MRRFALALSMCVVGMVVSSCAVGIRQAATEITTTSATLNGKVLSTTGGPGSWYIEYGPTAGSRRRTPTRTIDFVVNESNRCPSHRRARAATTYHFAVCAEDSENPGDPFCSPDQTFTTDSDPAADSVSGSAHQCQPQSPPLPPCSLQDSVEVDARAAQADRIPPARP